MVWFIIGLICLIIAAIAMIVRAGVPRDTEGRGGLSVAAVGFAVLALILGGVSMTTRIPTNSYGVVTTFGKPTGEVLANGLHATAPWNSVTKFDAARQVLVFEGGNLDLDKDRAPQVNVRLAKQATASVTGTLNYQIPKDGLVELFKAWKTEDRVKEHYVYAMLRDALANALGKYDPLAVEQQETNVLGRLSGEVLSDLRNRVGDKLLIHSVTLGGIDYDDTTEAKIKDLQGAIADGRVAEQRQKNAAAIAAANKIIGDSIKGDQNVVIQNCLNMVEQMLRAGHALPAGFSCFPGNGGVGVLAPPAAK